MEISNALGVFATIFGLVSLIGGAAGYFKASRGDSIIRYQATELALRDDKITGLKADLAAATQACEAKTETIAKLEQHNEYLQTLGQGSPQLKKMAAVQEKLIVSINNQTTAITALIERETYERRKPTRNAK